MHKALKFLSYKIRSIIILTFEFGEFLALLPLLILIVDNNRFESFFFQKLARDLMKLLIFFLSLNISCKCKPVREVTWKQIFVLEI
jgi:hypothetical protein